MDGGGRYSLDKPSQGIKNSINSIGDEYAQSKEKTVGCKRVTKSKKEPSSCPNYTLHLSCSYVASGGLEWYIFSLLFILFLSSFHRTKEFSNGDTIFKT